MLQQKKTIENFSSLAATLGDGWNIGVLVGYAFKKVIKLAELILGYF
jgi:uncharacterized membrane protein (Fun14 family)